MVRQKRFFIPFLILASTLLLTAVSNGQISIVSTTNSFGAASIGNSDRTFAQGWTMTSAYTDVSISAAVGNYANPGALIYAWLTTNIGPTITGADVIASTEITSLDSGSTRTIFSNLNLGAGTYYLVMTGGTNLDLNSADWFGASAESTAPGVTLLSYASAQDPATNTSNPPASTFTTNTGSYLDIQVTENLPAVPEPTTALFGVALVGVCGAARRRKVV
jgi:hypothetical protein